MAINLNPEAFAPGSLRDMTIEEVMSRLGQSERKRSDRDSNYQERSVPISYRITGNGLENSLERIGKEYNGSMVLNRCIAYHIESWYSNMPEMVEISDLYQRLLKSSDDHGFPDIGRWIKRTEQFELKNSVRTAAKCGVSSFASVGKLKSALTERSKVTGIDTAILFSIGAEWSVITNVSGWASKSIEKFYLPEIDNLKRYLKERLWYLQYCEKVINGRVLLQEEPL